ncbi:MAG: MATE family efflux transporter [Lentisphaerae bacterium]|nr:MATE family efflux transporter [Lentisphaerota bacterium]
MLRVAFPLILASSGHAIRIFADRVMLSRYSSEALAASLPAGLTSFAFMAVFIGTAGYCGSFVAQYVGAGREHEAGRAVWQGLYLSLLGAVVMLLISLKTEALFAWMGHPANVQAAQISYFRILCLFTAPVLILATLNSFWNGRGRTMVVMGLELFCAATNIVLNALLIFGRCGFPELGIAGAAYATGLSAVAGMVVAFVLFWRPSNRKRFNTFPRRTFNWPELRRLVRFGLPNGLQFGLDLMAFNLFVVFMGRLGMVELAAAGIVFGLNALAFLPIIGLGMAASIFVGQGIGAGDRQFARRGVRSTLIVALLYDAVMVALFVGLPDVTLALFAGGHTSPETLAMSRICLRFVAAYLLFDAVAVVYSHAIKGAGDTRFTMIVGVAMSWGLLVVPVYLVSRWGGSLWTMWQILVIHIILAAILYLWRYRTGRWESMRVIEAHPAPDGEVDVHSDRRGWVRAIPPSGLVCVLHNRDRAHEDDALRGPVGTKEFSLGQHGLYCIFL